MNTDYKAREQAETPYYDVVIVGAGLSGIGAAYHLQDKCPTKSYVIVEGREALGGTWDLFRYPGIRSDSDMYTLGYNFKPWRGKKSITSGPSILEYLQETAAENSIDRHIRYGHLVKKATWSSAEAAWTVEAQHKESGKTVYLRCNFLLMCAGYYSYEGGYAPPFKGSERFVGDIIHPQHWPEDFDYKDKQIIVIGSGATAVTLVPAMAADAAHVVMLQRSPTYVAAQNDEDKLAPILRRFLPERLVYAFTRRKYMFYQQLVYRVMRARPKQSKQKLVGMVRKALGPDYDVETHFVPRYDPWDQRVCIVPNGDLFETLKSGQASVVTDHIDTFTEKGIRLKSGQELEADIIITATGLNLVVLGDVEFIVDDKPVDIAKTYTYKGLMFSDVPNLTATFGYINASWTLRADLNAEYVCRLINHMDKRGVRQCTPRLRAEDRAMPARSFIQGFSSGYLQRSINRFAKQGDRKPWINPQRYRPDKQMLRRDPIEDGVLVFDPCSTAERK
ncbi:MAG: NAD(P)/FAD-dependent oxidoreductase [Anaerolineae bacterium]|nr:NAD(P)/FAD-dependent oxidoreductase [Anaerolineae bacterium]